MSSHCSSYLAHVVGERFLDLRRQILRCDQPVPGFASRRRPFARQARRLSSVGDRLPFVGGHRGLGVQLPDGGQYAVHPPVAVRADVQLRADLAQGRADPVEAVDGRSKIHSGWSVPSSPAVGLVERVGQRIGIARHEHDVAEHERIALGVLQARRREAAGEERHEFVGFGPLVEQGHQCIAITEGHRLDAAEDLHDLAGGNNPGADQAARFQAPAGGAVAYLEGVAGAQVAGREALAASDGRDIEDRAVDQQPLLGEQPFVVRQQESSLLDEILEGAALEQHRVADERIRNRGGDVLLVFGVLGPLARHRLDRRIPRSVADEPSRLLVEPRRTFLQWLRARLVQMALLELPSRPTPAGLVAAHGRSGLRLIVAEQLLQVIVDVRRGAGQQRQAARGVATVARVAGQVEERQRPARIQPLGGVQVGLGVADPAEALVRLGSEPTQRRSSRAAGLFLHRFSHQRQGLGAALAPADGLLEEGARDLRMGDEAGPSIPRCVR